MTPRRFINIIPKKYFFYKSWNYLKFQTSRFTNFKKINYLPVTMDIEPTTGCNFRCTMCQVSSPNFESKNMDLETFKKIILQNKQLIKIKLQGMGEPLVNKYIYEMISFAKNHGVATEIICNGSMLSKKNIDYLLNNKLAKLTISIDGATKEVFEKIRVKSNFNEVISNSKNFYNSIKNKLIRPEFSAWSTIQRDNFDQIEEIASLAKEVGFDNLTYQLFLTGWGKEEWEKVNNEKNINYKDQKIKSIFDNVIKKYSDKNFKIGVFEENLLNFNKKCSWPWNSAYLSAKGNVVPCCIVGDPLVVNMGNINDKSFIDIWKSEEYQKLRNNISNNRLDDFCKNCYFETKR
jgi:radical SAM protein with 4Fe4S-binding SPASM domain